MDCRRREFSDAPAVLLDPLGGLCGRFGGMRKFRPDPLQEFRAADHGAARPGDVRGAVPLGQHAVHHLAPPPRTGQHIGFVHGGQPFAAGRQAFPLGAGIPAPAPGRASQPDLRDKPPQTPHETVTLLARVTRAPSGGEPGFSVCATRAETSPPGRFLPACGFPGVRPRGPAIARPAREKRRWCGPWR